MMCCNKSKGMGVSDTQDRVEQGQNVLATEQATSGRSVDACQIHCDIGSSDLVH